MTAAACLVRVVAERAGSVLPARLDELGEERIELPSPVPRVGIDVALAHGGVVDHIGRHGGVEDHEPDARREAIGVDRADERPVADPVVVEPLVADRLAQDVEVGRNGLAPHVGRQWAPALQAPVDPGSGRLLEGHRALGRRWRGVRGVHPVELGVGQAVEAVRLTDPPRVEPDDVPCLAQLGSEDTRLLDELGARSSRAAGVDEQRPSGCSRPGREPAQGDVDGWAGRLGVVHGDRHRRAVEVLVVSALLPPHLLRVEAPQRGRVGSTAAVNRISAPVVAVGAPDVDDVVCR